VVFDDSDKYLYWTDDTFPAEIAYEDAAVAEDPAVQVPEIQVPAVQDQQVQGPLRPYPPRSYAEAPGLAPPQPLAQEQAADEDIPDPDLPPPMLREDDIEDIAVYWYKLRVDNDIGKAPVCFKMQFIAEKRPCCYARLPVERCCRQGTLQVRSTTAYMSSPTQDSTRYQ
jgi:hypothetical protein